MNAWPLVELRDVASIEREIVEPSKIRAGVLFVGLENIESGGRIVGVRRVDSGELASSKFAFTPRHVLYGKLRPYLAKIARPDFEGICSTDILPVLPGPDLDRSYLAWLLLTPEMVSLAASRATGANLPRLSAKALGDMQIPLPPLREQQRIAEILDKTDALRSKRRAAIAQLDSLTQSVFFDMFGDPATNPKGFPIRTLAEFYINSVEGTKCGPFGSALRKGELMESGVPVWNMDNIDPNGRMLLPPRLWITESKYRQLETYSVRNGDVVISRAGTVGKLCVVQSDYPASVISTNLIRVRFGPKLLPIYFVALMVHGKGRLGRLKTGPEGALTHMNTGVLDDLKFPYPPVELQCRFARILDSIEQQRARALVQLADIETLAASVRDRAFRSGL